ncbi:MAG: hypothetical protein K2Q18_13815 [Bdellovibrionales bacterium]|nr:hypothetical protein [Bdellovibrionales bacterium]
MKAAFVTLMITAFSIIITVPDIAHGMNKAGPHGGYIRMPGEYHIELVPDGKELRVYFLDMKFTPIPLNDATLELTLTAKKPLKAQCLREMHFFRCDIGEQSFKKFKEVVIESSLDGKTEATSNYKIPLKFM